jgi:hypothetical protein
MRQRCVRPITRLGKRVSEPLLHRFWPVQANRGVKAGTRVLFPGRHTTPFELVALAGRQQARRTEMARCRAQATRQGAFGTFGRSHISPLPVRAVLLFSSPNPKAARPSQTTVKTVLCAFGLFRLGAVGYLSILCRFRHSYPRRAARARLIGPVAVRGSRLLGLDAELRESAFCL